MFGGKSPEDLYVYARYQSTFRCRVPVYLSIPSTSILIDAGECYMLMFGGKSPEDQYVYARYQSN